MNTIIESLMNRKSMRVFEKKEISQENKELILKAATAAPTAGNQQLYTILDIIDQDLKDKLAVTCDNQPFIATAPLVLIFCANTKKWYDAFIEANAHPKKPGVGDLLLAVSDANIAAQNAVVAAESLGIGSCYIGDIMENREEHKQLLNLPDWVFPTAMLVFGYPTQQQLERQKPQRADMQYIVHKNTYQSLNGKQLREMFGNKTGSKTYDEWMKAFCERKYNSEFSKEMNRSVMAYLKKFM
ncbi:MAG: nitroreductase family protein [Thermotogota bacterium]|nr:nitroreductase family protein [Thermotogota bacterium]